MIFTCLTNKKTKDIAKMCLESFREYNKTHFLKIFCLNHYNKDLEKYGIVEQLNFCETSFLISNLFANSFLSEWASKLKIIEKLCKDDDVCFFDIDILFRNKIDINKCDKFSGIYDIHNEASSVLSKNTKYINAGFMIIPKGNYKLYEEFIKFIKIHKNSICVEQDFLSFYFNDKDYLNEEYNYGVFNKDNCIIDNPKIVHFAASFCKLWTNTFDINELNKKLLPYFNEYLKYFYTLYKELSEDTKQTILYNIRKFNLNYKDYLKYFINNIQN